MPILLQSDNVLYIAVSNKLITVNVSSGEAVSHDLPPIKRPENLGKSQEELFKELPLITTLSISKNGAFLVASTHNRQVVTFSTEDLTPLSNFIITRAASKLCFDHENNIIVADKTGDAYLYQEGTHEEPKLLLGHLSMLLDVQMTPCGKYIITSDRDEKIRVSHFPNCYNIVCYCLGHQEFVTNMAIVNNQLLSASGDGTLRLWDWTNGKEILQIDTNKLLQQTENVEKFKDVMDKDNIEVNAIPITDMQVYEYRTGFALIAVTLYQWNYVEVYEFNYKSQEILHVQQVNVKSAKSASPIVAISLNCILSILTSDELFLFSHNAEENKFVACSSEVQINVLKQYEDVFAKCSSKGDVSLLYKRKFDNVQDYLDRKKQRMGCK